MLCCCKESMSWRQILLLPGQLDSQSQSLRGGSLRRVKWRQMHPILISGLCSFISKLSCLSQLIIGFLFLHKMRLQIFPWVAFRVFKLHWHATGKNSRSLLPSTRIDKTPYDGTQLARFQRGTSEAAIVYRRFLMYSHVTCQSDLQASLLNLQNHTKIHTQRLVFSRFSMLSSLNSHWSKAAASALTRSWNKGISVSPYQITTYRISMDKR